MTLVQMISDIYAGYGTRFQVDVATILRYISIVQQCAFAKDLEAFQETATLTISPLTPKGPYAFPSTARVVMRVETSDGLVVPCTFQHMRRTATLLSEPSADLVWCYYLKPEELTADTDDSKVLVPSEWHYPVLVEGAIMLCDSASYGDKAPQIVLEPILAPLWAALSSLKVSERTDISEGAW